MLPANTEFIRNASNVKRQPERAIMDGIIQGSLNAFQRSAVDGLIASALPRGEHDPHGHKPLVHKGKGKAPKTPAVDGFMSYPGAVAAKRFGRK